VAVIGDVGGHLAELRRELVRLGADERTGVLPPDLTIIQVGDLIHRGPDSAGVIATVDRYLREQPDQWLQLVGNHEAQYLTERAFAWPEQLDEASAGTIRRWWSDRQMYVAAALSHDTADAASGAASGRHWTHEDTLVTHAGLTEGYWRRVLGSPDTAERTAQVLNAMRGRRDDLLFRSGQMLGGGRPNPAAGPLWAAAASELLPGWLEGWLPFSQVHGHTSLYRWSEQRFFGSQELEQRTIVDVDARHETTTLIGGRIVGIDPGHDAEPRGPWRVWELSS
jgi:hypothetical protein